MPTLPLTPRPCRLGRALGSLLGALGVLGLLACAGSRHEPTWEMAQLAIQPEIATAPTHAWHAGTAPAPRFARQAVATAHPMATQAGLRILRAGGSAVDAAVAVQAVLGLVEPQSSGIGGGAFLLVSEAGQIDAWDGRETAPAGVHEGWFLDAQGRPLPFTQAVLGGRSVGVPGVLRMLAAAHARHGRLPWAQLFAPAITLAETGFALSPRLAQQLAEDPALRRDPHARQLYYDSAGRALPAGTLLRNPDYAAVLRHVAHEGADAFYRGHIAEAMVRAVREHPSAPGVLTLADLAAYLPIRRNALCLPWRALRLCGMPPPSSGLITVGQTLTLLDTQAPAGTAALDSQGLPGADFLHAYAEAARLALADREAYIADPAFVAAPGGRWSTLLAPAYLVQRARLIGPHAAAQVDPGQPGTVGGPAAWARDTSQEIPATTHLSIIDANGQAIAMTSSIEAQFGARLMVNSGQGLAGGFLLNNQLTDFSFEPRREGRLVVNRVQPGKRPRSSMAPTLVFNAASGALQASLGAPGGPAIPHYVSKALLGVYAFGLSPGEALALPNFGPLPLPGGMPGALATTPLLLEIGPWPEATRAALRARGQPLRETALPSGVQMLLRDPDGHWRGAADPRREGLVLGD